MSKLGANTLVILVHGTFAKNAPWTKENSFFSGKLKEHTQEDYDHTFFNWGGMNSHSNRIRGGDALKALLLEYSTSDYKKIVLIGHSHGGNVILYALKNLSLPQEIKIVTMATPFINTVLQKRDSNLGYLVLINTIKYTIPYVTLCLVIFLIVFYFNKGYFSEEHPIVKMVCFFTFWLPIIWIYKKNKVSVKQRVWSKVVQRCDKISIAGNCNFKIFVTYVKGDKVKGWVKIWIKSSTLLLYIYDGYRIITELIWYATGKYLKYILLLGFLLALMNAFFPSLNEISDFYINAFSYAALIFIVVSIVYVLFNISMRVLLVFKESNLLILGFTRYSYRIFLKFDISHVPNHYPEVDNKAYNIKGLFGIKHSDIYNHEPAITDIANWISATDKAI